MAEAVKVNDSTWRLEEGFVRFFLLEGEEKAVLIDSGAGSKDAKAQAEALTDKPVILLNTHGDGDHTSGTAGFTEIYMHASDYTKCGVAKNYPDTALVEVNDGDVIDPGNRPLKIIHIPGHTEGSVAILDVNKRTLYAGDSVQKGHIYMFGAHRNPELFAASLEKLIAMKDEYDCIVASHDEPVLPADYAEKVAAAWAKVMNGEVEGETVDMHGNTVKSYTTEFCGFFMGL